MPSEYEQILRVYASACEEGIERIESCLLELEHHPDRQDLLNEAFRLCHTIKGDSRTVGFQQPTELAHLVEEVFEGVRTGARSLDAGRISRLLAAVDALGQVVQAALAGEELGAEAFDALLETHRSGLEIEREAEPSGGDAKADEIPEEPRDADATTLLDQRRGTLRVRTDVLDRMLNLTGELAIARSRLGRLISDEAELSRVALERAHHDMDLLFSELQEEVMQARMVPIGPIFRQQMRLVRDLALSDGKQARLEIRGAEAELDMTVVEHVRECLGHLVRNALSHGIEFPAEREAAGKDPCGRIELGASHEGGSIAVEVRDDGRGIDPAQILARARELGLGLPDPSAPREEILEILFTPGFSTRSEANLVSGRGVGLDVVRERLAALGGSVGIDSRPGFGTCIDLRLPLTLAIIDGFEVAVGSERYVIPLASVVECVDLVDRGGNRRAPTGMLDLRGQPLPYARLRNLLGADGESPPHEGVVVVRDRGASVGLAVDALLGERETVIKPLNGALRAIPAFAGSTILANGDVALILDVPQLLQTALRSRLGGAPHLGSEGAP